ncbi:MAG: malate-CoA ligase subunit beta [Gammaproteobacteria bacterium]
MEIHEYQAKTLLAEKGVAIARGSIAYTRDEALMRCREIGGTTWVVKAQVHSGARGKAGGVVLCRNEEEVVAATEKLLGTQLVTHQTGPSGLPVHRLYIEEASDIHTELYISFVLDRAKERIAVIASPEGGMDIEEVAENNPDAITRIFIEPAVGFLSFEARELAFALGIEPGLVNSFVSTVKGMYRTMRDSDATMLEVNPLVITKDHRIIALDAKMSFDDNALFRQTHISSFRDKSQEDPRETAAGDLGLSYVGLDGDIGCIINGAGLAMATMDMIKHVGGEPANFLDIGGGATPERVAEAFNLVLSDSGVKVILVNIFAGINRCDWVAEGVVQAVKAVDLKVPLVVRLSGTNVEEGRKILKDSGLPIMTPETLSDAANMAVKALSS